MAKVVAVALGPFNIVANIYNPRSVKALGTTVEYFKLSNRWKFSTSSCFSDNCKLKQ